jgi:hypothetical protein
LERHLKWRRIRDEKKDVHVQYNGGWEHGKRVRIKNNEKAEM